MCIKKWILVFAFFYTGFLYAGNVPAFYGTEKKIKVENASISYYRFGQGKPLVLVTGHGDTMMYWHPEMLKRLSQTRELVIFDYPGIGQSTTTGAFPSTMDELANLVHQFVKTQNFKKPDILGFSMGGSVVLKLATIHGEDYHKIIVVGGKAGGPKTVAPQQKYFKLLSDPSISPAKAVKTLLFPPTAAKEADAYLEVLAKLPQEKVNGKALQAQAKAVTKENTGKGIWDALGNVKNDVLILNGTEDVLTPVINAQRIANAIPGSWLVRIKGAGHGVLFQMPVFAADLILLFTEQGGNTISN